MAGRLPPREFNWARTIRTLSFWALLIVGSIALVQFASSRRQEAVDISYTQFTEQLDAGNVSAVEITERQQVKGDLKRPLTVGRPRRSSRSAYSCSASCRTCSSSG